MSTNKDNFISSSWATYKKAVPSPMLSAVLLGAGAYGISRLAWNPITDTVRSLARYPGKKLSGMTNAEWDEAMDSLKHESKYRKWIPAALGAAVGAGALASSYRGNREYRGLIGWDENYNYTGIPGAGYKPPDFSKEANESFLYDSFNHSPDVTQRMNATRSDALFNPSPVTHSNYMNDIDFSRTINATKSNDLFTNDPHLQNNTYVRHMGSAIINNAAINAGTQRPTLGNVFDSAADKISTKLSFGGLASIGVKSVISNATARLFTGALGAMTSIGPEAQRNIVDAGTWAGTVISILE